MNISFKPIASNDIDTLLTFIQEYYDYDRHLFEPVSIRLALETLMLHPDWGRTWLICRDELPIGYVVLTLGYSLEYRGRDAFVDEIYIREADRHQGVGRATFQFVEEVCRSLHVNALHLEVEPSNVIARTVYRKLGFADHNRQLLTRRFIL